MWMKSGEPADSYYEVRPEYSDEVAKTRFKIKLQFFEAISTDYGLKVAFLASGKTLSVRRWQAAFSSEGYLDIGPTLSRIHRGGIHPSIRGEVWEFLLGCFGSKSTFEERNQLRQHRRILYAQWKEDCRQMDTHVGSGTIITAPIITDDGEPIKDPLVLVQAVSSANFVDGAEANKGSGDEAQIQITDKKIVQWKLTLHQIGLDVLRTDRTLAFYEKQSNLAKLWDILAVYAWIDKDVGYCQGMSDLCSPMIMLLQDEADAFWCFERLMRRVRGNFKCTEKSVGVENQLQCLASINQILDPKLHQHLETLGGGDYIFAFRMFMVLFRREFSFGDSLYLWEMMWALEYDPGIFLAYEEQGFSDEMSVRSREKIKSIRQFGKYERENLRNGAKGSGPSLPISIFLVASVLKEKSDKLLKEAKGLDDVVKILNDITGNLDAKKACSCAVKLHKKYLRKAKRT